VLPIDHSTRELQAEAVAYIVSRHYGFTVCKCPNYIALSCLEDQGFESSIPIIQKTASEIIGSVLGLNNIVIP